MQVPAPPEWYPRRRLGVLADVWGVRVLCLVMAINFGAGVYERRWPENALPTVLGLITGFAAGAAIYVFRVRRRGPEQSPTWIQWSRQRKVAAFIGFFLLAAAAAVLGLMHPTFDALMGGWTAGVFLGVATFRNEKDVLRERVRAGSTPGRPDRPV